MLGGEVDWCLLPPGLPGAHGEAFELHVLWLWRRLRRRLGIVSCLRCRPETAPEFASWRGTSNTVSRALALIADGALDGKGKGKSVDALAERLGVGERQLRRLFVQHLGASPIAVAQTRRVLFAKQLIHDTRMSMTEVALAAGFSSLRRFNEVFQELFKRPPSALRRKSARIERSRGLCCGYATGRLMTGSRCWRFWRRGAIPGVEGGGEGDATDGRLRLAGRQAAWR